MKLPAIAVAMAIPVAVTCGALIEMTWNRAGVRGPIALSQREAAVGARSADNSAATVSLSWQQPEGRGTWLGREKLEALGFDCSVPPDSPDAEWHYRRQLQREAYVAFELDGPAWRALLEARESTVRTTERLPPGFLRDYGSRLVAIDAAPEAGTLTARYPDGGRYLVSLASIAVERRAPEGEAPYVTGVITGIYPRRIHVPASFAAQLPPPRADQEAPGYTVLLQYGRRSEPWVVGVQR